MVYNKLDIWRLISLFGFLTSSILGCIPVAVAIWIVTGVVESYNALKISGYNLAHKEKSFIFYAEPWILSPVEHSFFLCYGYDYVPVVLFCVVSFIEYAMLLYFQRRNANNGQFMDSVWGETLNGCLALIVVAAFAFREVSFISASLWWLHFAIFVHVGFKYIRQVNATMNAGIG